MDIGTVATIEMFKSILSGMVEFAQKGSVALNEYTRNPEAISFDDEMKLKGDFFNLSQALNNLNVALAMLVIKGFEPDMQVIQNLDSITSFYQDLHLLLIQFPDRTGGVK
jgi:hypothetical protein